MKTSQFLFSRPHWSSIPHFLWTACEIYGRRNFDLHCFSDCSPQIFKGVKQEHTLDRSLIVLRLYPDVTLPFSKRKTDSFDTEVLIILHRWADTSRSEEGKHQRWLTRDDYRRHRNPDCMGYSWDNYAKMTLQYSFTHTHTQTSQC